MIAETLSLDFVGNAAGLQDAVLASQRALQALNRDTSRFSFSIGRVMRTIVTPIASIILSAFAAKKALADFTQSGLPGVSQFNQSLGLMRISMFRLSSAVGELLAPAAERAARIVTWIADRLEPIIRQITANIPAMAALLRQFGANLLGALRPLMPTVFGIIDGILARFQNADWGQVLAELWRIWQQTWTGILNFVGPVLVRVATLLDTAVRVGRDGLVQLFTWLTQKAAEFGITLPNTLKALNTFTELLQAGIVMAVSALEVAIENIPMLWKAAQESALVAVTFMQDNWRGFVQWIQDSLGAALANAGTLFINLFDKVDKVLIALGKNIYTVITESLKQALASIGAMIVKPFEMLQYALVQGMTNAWSAIESVLIEMEFRFKKLFLYDIDNWFDQGVKKFLDTPGVPDWILPLHDDKMQRNQDTLAQLVSDRNAALVDIARRTRMPAGFGNNSGPVPFQPMRLAPLTFNFAGLTAGMMSMPALKATTANMKDLNTILEQINKTFGAGVAARIKDAFLQGPKFIAQIMGGLIPGFFGKAPAPRIDRFESIGPLLFGTAAANAKETNVGNKNPLVPIAQQQLALTREQLVQQRAAAKAAERKARMAHF